MFSSSSEKPTEQHIHDDHVCTYHSKEQPTITEHVKQHSLQTTQSTRDRPKQRAAIKARSHPTDDKRLSLARSWLPPLPRRCCVLLLLLLRIIAVLLMLLLCASVESLVYFVCVRLVRSRTSTPSHQGAESSNGR